MCNNQPMPNPGPPPEILIVAQTDAATGDVRAICRGRLVSGHADEFYESVRQFIPNSKRIVLDFNELTNMDSSGLGIDTTTVFLKRRRSLPTFSAAESPTARPVYPTRQSSNSQRQLPGPITAM